MAHTPATGWNDAYAYCVTITPIPPLGISISRFDALHIIRQRFFFLPTHTLATFKVRPPRRLYCSILPMLMLNFCQFYLATGAFVYDKMPDGISHAFRLMPPECCWTYAADLPRFSTYNAHTLASQIIFIISFIAERAEALQTARRDTLMPLISDIHIDSFLQCLTHTLPITMICFSNTSIFIIWRF